MNRSRSRFTAATLPSRRIYAAADEARLHPLRARVTVLELEGALFFGSADRIAELKSLERALAVMAARCADTCVGGAASCCTIYSDLAMTG